LAVLSCAGPPAFLQRSQPFFREPILLQAASWFVRDGAFQKATFEQGLDVRLEEMYPIFQACRTLQDIGVRRSLGRIEDGFDLWADISHMTFPATAPDS